MGLRALAGYILNKQEAQDAGDDDDDTDDKKEGLPESVEKPISLSA
ncbi:hypothetical protein [Leptonema illini]|nr:hypothetical protein [Leptonema illini]